MWNEITNEVELNDFIALFGGFHDSCIKEMKYISGAFVNKNLAMHPINSERKVNVIFQRQFRNPSVVEVEFIGVSQLKLSPVEEAYTCELGEATMGINNHHIFWCDCGGISQDELDRYEGTFICSRRVRWRIADEYIGKDEIYKSI